MRLRDGASEYYYIYTHVDWFKVVVDDPSIWIDLIASDLVDKEYGPRN